MASEEASGNPKSPSSSRSQNRELGNNRATSKQSRKETRVSKPGLRKEMLQEKNAVKEKLGRQGPPPGYVFVPKGDIYNNSQLSKSFTRDETDGIYRLQPQTRRTLDLDAPSQSASSTLAVRTTASPKRTHETSRKPALTSALNSPPCLQDSRRVGRSGTVQSEKVRVQLAVDAHVRHVHTDYEALLTAGVGKGDTRERI
ncbi:hypothetical protein PAAG_08791 [Paracoccidioides lutzii Pb01]|uniref:DUF2293 domain-containing protein n=1 Tax=Paracoccidioides lutzii (strain ATCC MYA-826 / Pb01) TaxID=502779 RepID=C1HDF0_PARBA|nr:hypothetical protein PAAG_08791 [Paracoccidioides lutzii Pb01]EEH39522.2 hypothetical protein PAAG_08791 [Paracoccidioides lutzii Pb01]